MPRLGIFCLEGEWSINLAERISVEPSLELLERLKVAKYLHRDYATKGELEYYLSRHRQARYSSYKVLFFAAHGAPGCISLDRRESVRLDELAAMIGPSCDGKVIYFGSCSILKVLDEQITEFAKQTRARAIVGYRKDVDWLDSAAFEIVLLDAMIRGTRSDGFFNGLIKEHPVVARKLGLVVATKATVHKA